MDDLSEVFEWMPFNHYDPQGRIRERFAELGHEFGKWEAGPDMPVSKRVHYTTTYVSCEVCAQWAMYGALRRPNGSRKLAIWGPALVKECMRGPKLIAGIPARPAAPAESTASQEADNTVDLTR